MDNFDVTDNDNRLTTYPIVREDLWKFVKDTQRLFWTVEEIKLSEDRDHFTNKLDEKAQRCIKYILAFFASSDKVVNINITERFIKEIPYLEAENFYNFQVTIENVHSEMYSLLLITIINDPIEREELLNAVRTKPIIKKMTDWIYECISDKTSLGNRLLRMACVEGIFFSSCFCIIYWFQEKGLMPGLTQSNEFIARDEGKHTEFALYLYANYLKNKLTVDQIYSIFDEAVTIAIEFAQDMMPDHMMFMNSALMSDYIKYVANGLLSLINVPPLYDSIKECPFSFMKKINMLNKTNFFERRVTEYSKPTQTNDNEFSTCDDF